MLFDDRVLVELGTVQESVRILTGITMAMNEIAHWQ